MKGYGSLFILLSIIGIILWILKYGVKNLLHNSLILCFIAPTLSVIATIYTSGYGGINSVVRPVILYTLPVILYYAIETEKDVKFYVICMGFFLLIAMSYALYEELTQSNPIMGWCYRHPEYFQWLSGRSIDYEFRYGFKRAQSFFSGEAAFATVCIYTFLIIISLRYNKYKLVSGFIGTILMFTSPIFVFLTGTRSAMFALAVGALMFVSPKYLKRYWYYVAIVAIIVILVLPTYFQSIWNSIINSDMDANVAGSSSVLREGQWDIALLFMAQNPITGNGLNFTEQLIDAQYEGLWGAEGMWLPIMMNQGLLGVISILLVYVFTILILIRKKLYNYIWIIVSFFVYKTVTTVVGVPESYYLFIIVFLMRFNDIFINNKLRNERA